MNKKLKTGLKVVEKAITYGPFAAAVFISPNTWDKIDDGLQKAHDFAKGTVQRMFAPEPFYTGPVFERDWIILDPDALKAVLPDGSGSTASLSANINVDSTAILTGDIGGNSGFPVIVI